MERRCIHLDNIFIRDIKHIFRGHYKARSETIYIINPPHRIRALTTKASVIFQLLTVNVIPSFMPYSLGLGRCLHHPEGLVLDVLHDQVHHAVNSVHVRLKYITWKSNVRKVVVMAGCCPCPPPAPLSWALPSALSSSCSGCPLALPE